MRGSELTIQRRLEAYATLTRRVVAVGFGSDGASPYHSTSMSLPISLPTSRIEPAAEAPVLR